METPLLRGLRGATEEREDPGPDLQESTSEEGLPRGRGPAPPLREEPPRRIHTLVKQQEGSWSSAKLMGFEGR
jgi:hypothetical protein